MSQASFPMVPTSSLEVAILPILLSIHGPGMHGILSFIDILGPQNLASRTKCCLNTHMKHNLAGQ